MKAFIKRINLYFFIFLLLNIKHFTLLASESSYILSLPSDIKKLILVNTYSEDETQYVIKSVRDSEELIIPYTIRPINLVTEGFRNVFTGHLPLAKPGDHCYLGVELWHGRARAFLHETDNFDRRFHLNKNTGNIYHHFVINDVENFETQFFDGMNYYYSAILAQTNNNFFTIYYISTYDESNYNQLYNPKYTGSGCLRSIMLHPMQDSIVFSTQHCNTQFKEKPFTMVIGDITFANDERIFDLKAETYLDFLIRKTIYLGKQTYLAMTEEGRLVVLWQDKDGRIQHCLQKHISKIIDIAVDNTVITKNGFRPHIACLNDKDELFVCNLLAFTQPILFFIKQVTRQNKRPFRLFYDKQQCAILYTEVQKDNKLSKFCDFVVWPDNLAVLCNTKILGLFLNYYWR